MSLKKSPPLRVAIVGASTLKGQELKSALLNRKFPVKKLVLLDTDEDLGRLSEFDGEPVFSLTITESSFEFLDVVFFAGSPETTRAYAHLAKRNEFLLVDLTHAFFEDPAIPVFHESRKRGKTTVTPHEGLVSAPHPAALTLASILEPLSRQYEIGNCVASIFEPASEPRVSAADSSRKCARSPDLSHSSSRDIFPAPPSPSRSHGLPRVSR